MRRIWAALLAAVLMLGMGSCGTDNPVSPGRDHVTTPSPVSAVSGVEAAALLAALPQQPRPAAAGAYISDSFGPAWYDVDGNGCNQRDDVLLRDAVPGTTRIQRQGACDHDVLAGTWTDPYTGARLTFTDLKDQSQAQALQIDHVVALAEAWVSGASSWSDRRRLRFANDLDGLVASSGPVNASKGASDPAAWRPKKAYQCSYASRWIQVKHRWGLAVDDSESRALAEMLGTCGG